MSKVPTGMILFKLLLYIMGCFFTHCNVNIFNILFVDEANAEIIADLKARIKEVELDLEVGGTLLCI